MERHLTTLFGIVESADLKNFEAPAAPRQKRGWLPLLTVLFMISYGLMTMLIVEQGRTIESQRALIQELFGDSAQLSALKMKASVQRAQAAQAQSDLAQAPAGQSPSSQNQNQTQNPSAQAPATKQAPSSQAVHRKQSQVEKPFRMPSRPASDLADSKRALITI
jgi:cytoskeletal protein RodZ